MKSNCPVRKMKDIMIRTNQIGTRNDHFWAASGLDELFAFTKTEAGEYLTSRMQEKGTCRYVRNHFTLNREIINGVRCGGDVYAEDTEGNPVYDFTWINDIFRRIINKGMKPVVEMDFMPDPLIGNSGGITQEGFGHKQSNRYCPNDWDKWDALLKTFMQNLVDTFGLEEIRTWYFEVWNEPDSWPVDDWDNFYRLYDVFAEAVKSVDQELRVGGPACFRMPLFYAFLNYVANGTNHVTGKKGVPLDFISYHIYGMSGGWLKEYPLVMPTVQRFVQELLWVQRAINTYPSLKGTEFLLNEWGVISNYERSSKEYPPLEVRNSEFSALFAVKLVDCIESLRKAFDLPLTMLLYWGFCNEDTCGTLFNGNRSLTTAHHICKPIQTAHEFLAMLGEEMLAVEGMKAGCDEGVLAAKSGTGVQALVYYFNEYDAERNLPDRDYRIDFQDMEAGLYCLKVYTMDDTHNNTYRLWQRLGAPEELTAEELKLLHAEQEITADVEQIVEIKDGNFSYETKLSSVSMKLIALTKK